MKIENIPFTITDWGAVAPVEHPGESGTSRWRTRETGPLRVRVVEYSPGFGSDHDCPRGHVLLVLEGEPGIVLKDGGAPRLTDGMSFQAGDDEANPHLAFSEKGARVFIVD